MLFIIFFQGGIELIKVSIIGATGYTGSELMRLLAHHPHVQLVHLTARKLAGQRVSHCFPFLTPALKDKHFVELDIQAIRQDSDLVFICLPHGHSMNLVKELGQQVKIIDLGADFRLKNIDQYETYYQVKQAAPTLLNQAVYGLSEYYRQDIKSSQLIANPGCFVTNALLALLPLAKAQVIDLQSIIIDSKTGISGAGRGASVSNLLSEAANNFNAYNPLSHRHIPEIEQELSRDGQVTQIQFTPHLLPTERGIFSTIYAKPSQLVTEEDLRQIFRQAYDDEPFVHLLESEQLPSIKSVRGSNHCHIQVKFDKRTHRIIIFSVIDNLVKGASGQAVQNMNLLFDLDETLGLQQLALMP